MEDKNKVPEAWVKLEELSQHCRVLASKKPREEDITEANVLTTTMGIDR